VEGSKWSKLKIRIEERFFAALRMTAEGKAEADSCFSAKITEAKKLSF